MDGELVAVVLAGGTGTRLFPASRPTRPKQFLDFGGEQSLLSRTVERASFADRRYVLTRPEYADEAREQAPGAAVLTEPAAKDTGPALVYAAHRIRQQVDDPVMLCLPSDHRVGTGFVPVARRAAHTAAQTGGLVTIGIEPDRPATGYGYIEPVEEVSASGPGGDRSAPESAERVARFVEKPDAETAAEYLDSGWYWNSGVFSWTPEALLNAAADTSLSPLVRALESGNPASGFDAVDAVSVDNAILETAEELYVVPGSFEWDDLGSWDALARVLEAGPGGNATVGETLAVDSENCVLATDSRVSAVGVEGLVVASFDGHTLVVPREESQRVREIADSWD